MDNNPFSCFFVVVINLKYLLNSLDGQKFVARLSAETAIRSFQSVNLAFVMDKVHSFDKETELRIRPVPKAVGLVVTS